MKKVGDAVKRDEPIFEISTDKVDAEIPAPTAGVLAEILVQEGQTVAVQTVVARIETEAGAAAPPRPPRRRPRRPRRRPRAAGARRPAPAARRPPAPAAAAPPPPPPPARNGAETARGAAAPALARRWSARSPRSTASTSPRIAGQRHRRPRDQERRARLPRGAGAPRRAAPPPAPPAAPAPRRRLPRRAPAASRRHPAADAVGGRPRRAVVAGSGSSPPIT